MKASIMTVIDCLTVAAEWSINSHQVKSIVDSDRGSRKLVAIICFFGPHQPYSLTAKQTEEEPFIGNPP